MAEEDKNSSPLDEGTEIIAHTAQTAYATTAAVAAGGTAAGMAAGTALAGPLGTVIGALVSNKTVWKILVSIFLFCFLWMFIIANMIGIIFSYLGFANADSYANEAQSTQLTNIRDRVEEVLQQEDYKKEIEALRHKLQEKNDKIDQTRDRILREANEKARDILREAKDTADETIRIFQKAGPGASMKDLEQARQKLRSNIDDKNSKLSVAAKDKPKAPALKPEQLKKGDAVRIVSMGLKGTVSSLPDAKGNLFVQCGIMRTSTNIKDLVRIEEATITTPTMSKTNTGKLRMSKSFSVSPEINLLGKTVDEALAALDKYLDDAYLAHLESVRVVHGKGTGALRKAIQQHLKRIKYVKSFRQGEYGEGDAGVTIVEFKK